jgi:HEAT repeat protein
MRLAYLPRHPAVAYLFLVKRRTSCTVKVFIMAHVFLSYVRDNSDIVDVLAGTLRAFGIETWLDREQIKPGTRWRDTIRDGIQEGAFFIACFSSEYNQRTKSYMNEELTLAIDELRQRPTDQAWFIPALLNECDIPDRNIGGGETLRAIQCVKLYPDLHEGIAQILAVIQPGSAVVFRLIRQLSDRSARTRIRAVDNLGQMGKLAEQALPKLVELLDDENETVSAAAADALGKIGIPDRRVILKLLSITGDDGHAYYPSKHANSSLVAMGFPAVSVLIEALAHEDFGVREAALKTLIEIGEPAVSPLVTALASENVAISGGAAAALGAITKRGESLSSSIPQLIRFLQQDANDDSPEYYRKVEAADALGAMGDPSAVPALIGALADPNLLCVSAAMALGKLRDPRAIGPLVEVLCDTNKFWVPRGAAAVALGNMGRVAESALDALRTALGHDTTNSGENWDERAHEAVVDAIQRIQNPSAPSMLTGRGYRYEMWGMY